MSSEATLRVTVNDEGLIEITTSFSPTIAELAKTEADKPLPMSHIIVNDLFENLSRMESAIGAEEPTIMLP